MARRYDPRDRFYRKARAEGYRARSAYKLEEIARRSQLLRRGMSVLDLGAAPGGWLQVIAREVGPQGTVIGVDLEAIAPLPPPVRTLVHDVRSQDLEPRLREAGAPPRFDLVTSDMAPRTTGERVTDEARSLELARMALATAERLLAEGGSFVAKVFEGGDFAGFLREVQARFEQVKLVRPEATRGGSVEIFVVARGFAGRA
jgi:23S rRNA (uridine2552-2'-O)-methyltransferase